MPSYTNGGVIVDADDPLTGANLTAEIGSIQSVDIAANIASIADDSGGIYDEGHAITQFAPVANVTTKSLAEVFSVIGLAGQCFIDGASNPGVAVYGTNRGDCLTDVESNQHSRYLFANGLMMLGSLQANRGADATLSFSIHGITDGTNAPLQISHAQTLPAALIKGQWELAICKIAGTSFKPESVSVNFGNQETKPKPLAPSIWPERIAVQKVQPTISFRGIDPQLISSSDIDITGESATHVNTIIQLVKRLSGSSYVAAGTAVHVRLTAAGLAVVTNPFSASGQGDATVDVEVRTIHDGTNVPIIINAASTYSAVPT